MTLVRRTQVEWRTSSWTERRALLQDILDWVVDHMVRRKLIQTACSLPVCVVVQDEVTTMSMNDSGKTALEATLGEVMTTCEKIRWIIAHGALLLAPCPFFGSCVQPGEGCLAKEERPVPSVMWMMKKAWVEWSPVGVVGIIVPWVKLLFFLVHVHLTRSLRVRVCQLQNYPVHNIFSHVVAALFAGNGALVKVCFCWKTLSPEASGHALT